MKQGTPENSTLDLKGMSIVLGIVNLRRVRPLRRQQGYNTSCPQHVGDK